MLSLGMLGVAACRQAEHQAYTGVLGYWTADARARAHDWNCRRVSSTYECGGLVGDTAYNVISDSAGTVLRVQKRWLVPPGRMLRHLMLLASGFGGPDSGRQCDPSHPERLMWQASGYRIQLWPQGDSVGYVLLADDVPQVHESPDTVACTIQY